MKSKAPENGKSPCILVIWPGELFEAAPVNVADAGSVELDPALIEAKAVDFELELLEAAAVALPLPAVGETMATLGVPGVVEELADAVSSGTVDVPLIPYTTDPDIVEPAANGNVVVLSALNMMALAEIVGLVANMIVELSIVMTHCVVTAGLVWKTMLEVPEDTTHSVLLPVAEKIGVATGDNIVVTNDKVDKLNSGWIVTVPVLYTVGVGGGGVGGAESASQ
jgi:hypothetical protein